MTNILPHAVSRTVPQPSTKKGTSRHLRGGPFKPSRAATAFSALILFGLLVTSTFLVVNRWDNLGNQTRTFDPNEFAYQFSIACR